MATSALSEDQLAHLMQFLHPEKLLAQYPGPPLPAADLAWVLGTDEATYRRLKERNAARVAAAAQTILADPAQAAAVDSLPFEQGSTVVGLGDSITDDAHSWLEILRALLTHRHGADGIRVVNAGISGDTTAQMVARFAAIAAMQPDWIICLAGTNDARRHGIPEAVRMANLEQTAEHLHALRRFAARAGSRWIWMTPPPVIEAQIVADWNLGPLELSYRNEDLAEIAAVIKGFADPVVDLQDVFGTPADPALLLPDGLHPSLEGQMAIVGALLGRLALG